MSSILDATSSTPMMSSYNSSGGLDIVAEQGQLNNFKILGDAPDKVIGGELIDIIQLGLGNDSANGGAGDDTLEGERGDDILVGGSGTDLLKGGLGEDILFGGKDGDILEGGDGDDKLFGEEGNDVLKGGKGSDIMTGGEGSDIFEFQADDFAAGELDKILDFEDGADLIQLKGIGADAEVKYDSETGVLSVDGKDIAQLSKHLDLTIEDQDGNGNWELF